MGLRQTAPWRTPTGDGVSRPLHSSVALLQQPAPRGRQRPGHLPVERLPPRRNGNRFRRPPPPTSLAVDFRSTSCPWGSPRIRHFGFLTNRPRKERLALCRESLTMPASELLPGADQCLLFLAALATPHHRLVVRSSEWTSCFTPPSGRQFVGRRHRRIPHDGQACIWTFVSYPSAIPQPRYACRRRFSENRQSCSTMCRMSTPPFPA